MPANRNREIARRAFLEYYGKDQPPGPHALVHWQRLVDLMGRIFADEWDRTLAPGNVAGAYRWVAHHMIDISCMPEHEARPDPRMPGVGRVP